MLSSDTCFIDLGEDIGSWSLRIAQADNLLPILAIEANPEIFTTDKDTAEKTFEDVLFQLISRSQISLDS